MKIPEGASLIIEGSTELWVPKEHSGSGPGKRTGRVFFNEQMSFNRDISVMFFRAIGRSRAPLMGWRALDQELSGYRTNPRRMSNSLSMTKMNLHAIISMRTSRLNQLTNCEVNNEDIRSLLTRKVFSYIDIDPFGTPVHASSLRGTGFEEKGHTRNNRDRYRTIGRDISKKMSTPVWSTFRKITFRT